MEENLIFEKKTLHGKKSCYLYFEGVITFSSRITKSVVICFIP